MKIKNVVLVVIAITLVSVLVVWAGDPDSPDTPANTNWYTLEDIYNRLDDGTTGSQSAFTEPAAGPPSGDTGTMHTLNEIMDVAPEADDTNGATAADVESGKTFWGLTSGEWGLQTGTATGGGTTYEAGVPQTGQTTCYDTDGNVIDCADTGQDGELQRGVAWPNPRFTDNDDGTVTDNLTGLIWLKNANCAVEERDWATALADVAQLNTDGTMNSNDCGDTSNGGDHQTDWRLPHMRELQSLVHYGQADSATWLNDQGFTGVQSDYYWSSTTYADNNNAWFVSLSYGNVSLGVKHYGVYVWPVRAGQ